MIWADKITNFQRSNGELEELLLFSIAVAGKTANTIAYQLEAFLALERRGITPFAKVRNMVQDGILLQNLKKAKLGKYSLLKQAYKELAFANIDLKKCSVKDLERFTGIGPKTSRFFILHTRPRANVAVLDTHILKWMSKMWPEVSIPKSTPSQKKYLVLEQKFLQYCNESQVDPATLDLEIWTAYSRKSRV